MAKKLYRHRLLYGTHAESDPNGKLDINGIKPDLRYIAGDVFDSPTDLCLKMNPKDVSMQMKFERVIDGTPLTAGPGSPAYEAWKVELAATEAAQAIEDAADAQPQPSRPQSQQSTGATATFTGQQQQLAKPPQPAGQVAQKPQNIGMTPDSWKTLEAMNVKELQAWAAGEEIELTGQLKANNARKEDLLKAIRQAVS